MHGFLCTCGKTIVALSVPHCALHTVAMHEWIGLGGIIQIQKPYLLYISVLITASGSHPVLPWGNLGVALVKYYQQYREAHLTRVRPGNCVGVSCVVSLGPL